jgi:hypothetical protein
MNMDNDKLIEKLESLEVPDAPVESHRLKLREALMSTVAVRGLEKEPTYWDNLKSRLDSFGVLFQRPVLRVAFSACVALVVCLSLFLGYRLTGDVSPTVLASDIALNSPEVPGMLEGTGDVRILNINISNGTARVICGRNMGSIVQVDIDLKSRKMLRAQRLSGLFMSELTEIVKADAIKIAMADPRVKQMVLQGGRVKKVMPSLSAISGVTQINEDMLKILSSGDKAVVQMDCDGKSWLIQTNLNEHSVERIIEPQLRTPPALRNEGKTS